MTTKPQKYTILKGTVFIISVVLILFFVIKSIDSSNSTQQQQIVIQQTSPIILINDEVNNLFNNMTTEERAAQMIMVATSEKKGIGLPFEYVKHLVKNNEIGSVLFLKGNSNHFKKWREEMDTLANSGKANLLYACDCEPTLFHKKFTDQDSVLPASQIPDTIILSKVLNKINGRMSEMGLTVNFAPVVDMSLNEEVIKDRSFGYEPNKIIELSDYFIIKSKKQGIACAVKHFPGHGNVKGDTHKQSVFIDGELTELKTFTNIIKNATPDFVMIGHMSIINNDLYNTFDKPCSISKNIVTGLLKEKLGFNGIVITDAMNMIAIKKYVDADWQAILAGNDIILMPNDAESLHHKICTALKNNDEISLQLETSIKKVLKLKLMKQINI
jgi:beta-N-acetylhexosaminidase